MCQKGQYRCVDNSSICNQKISAFYFDEILTGIRVEYVGDCLGQGSNFFSCEKELCISSYQEIILIGQKQYIWKNEMHNFECKFDYID